MMTDEQRLFLNRTSTPLQTSDPEVPFTLAEHVFLEQILDSADVIGIGEMTHGSREIFRAKDRLLRHLILHHDVTRVVLEANVPSTRLLNQYVLTLKGDLQAALAATGYWSIANQETLAFVIWLAEYNSAQNDQAKKVQIFGCDCQSLDATTAEILEAISNFRDQGLIQTAECQGIEQQLESLPKDQECTERMLALFEELDCANPSPSKVDHIKHSQAEFVSALESRVIDAADSLNRIAKRIDGQLTNQQRFFFTLHIRLMLQCLEHFKFEAGGEARDRHMAANIISIHQLQASGKMAVTSGNWHVSRTPIRIEGRTDYVTTGAHLSKELGDAYRVIASAIGTGSYLGSAGDTVEANTIHEMHEARRGSIEHYLSSFVKESISKDHWINLGLHRDQSTSEYIPKSLRMNIGEAGPKKSYEETFLAQQPTTQYDALMFVSRSSPIEVLAGYYTHWNEADQ